MASFLGIFKKEVIGPVDDPYLIRIDLTPWKFWPFPVGFYLHIFFRPDAEPWLHDHPRKLTSFIIWGGYTEERGSLVLRTDERGAVKLPSEFRMRKWLIKRKRWERVDLPLNTKHRIVELERVPTVTILMIKRKKERFWGFWIDQGDQVKFVSHDEYFKKSGGQPELEP